MKYSPKLLLFVTILVFLSGPLYPAGYKKVIFSSTYTDLADFEQFAARAKQSGATHIGVSSDLPKSFWEYDHPGDPYPAWTIYSNSLLKVAPPPALKKYMPADYSESVLKVLEARCKILRRLGLKATYSMKDPSMLPEAVFTDHPLWRGARVDHPSRSRVARFAPTIDNPEVLTLFRESVAILIRRCPEIDLFTITTNDSGAGLDWSEGLYSGRFGNTLYRDRPMDARIRGFLDTLQAGARDAGGETEVRITLTRESDPKRVAAKLARGTAIENIEGADCTPFSTGGGVGEGYGNVYNPVYGIPQPVQFLSGLVASARTTAPRLSVNMGDRRNRDLYFLIYDKFQTTNPVGPVEQLAFLREIAAAHAGAGMADAQLKIWVNVQDCTKYIRLLDTGGILFYLGGVHQRWVTRPFVPFPEELADAEKAYYRPYLFQALDESKADNLADVQATDSYYGWSGRHFVKRVLDPVEALVDENIKLAREIGNENLARRFEVFKCIQRNTRNAVSYQAQLDRVRDMGIKPLKHAVIETMSDWDRQLMMETAREEIDNTALLMQLLGDNPGEFLLIAPTKEETDIMLFGPDFIKELQMKLNIMNSKWEDYKRVFTVPNW
ncbi:hypothetical protein OH491_18160 [Termitidicoccus mucosus]|uniref:Uncharacterized protein n=1 Tax=Termitidicoccus mucosus TaxID=1184151 RepID=A0A178IKV0_9BACT|nr:hypothetical protein AW736_10450 [Opitutaceae bacterium TSB47]